VRLGEVVHGLDLDSEGRSVRSLRLASSSLGLLREISYSLAAACKPHGFLLDLRRTVPQFSVRRGAARTILHGAFDGQDRQPSSCMIRARSRTLTTASTKTVTGIVEDSAFPLRFNGRTNSSTPCSGWETLHFTIQATAAQAASSIYLNLNLPIARMKYFSSDFVSFPSWQWTVGVQKAFGKYTGRSKRRRERSRDRR